MSDVSLDFKSGYFFLTWLGVDNFSDRSSALMTEIRSGKGIPFESSLDLNNKKEVNRIL